MRTPDVVVQFQFNGTRKYPANDGYSPSHMITDGYLTSGVHHYNGIESVPVDGAAVGTITFITPEAYPNTLWEGKQINIQEGERIVGCATVIEVLNPILNRKNKESD